MEKEVWLISAVCLLCKHVKWERGKRACSLLPAPTPRCCGSGSTRTWRCCGGRTRSRRTSCGSTSSATSGTWWRSRRPSRPWSASPPPRPGSRSPTSWSRSSASTACAWPPASASQRWGLAQGRGGEAARALRNSLQSSRTAPQPAVSLAATGLPCRILLQGWFERACSDLKISRALKACACQTESQVLKPKRSFPVLLNCRARR